MLDNSKNKAKKSIEQDKSELISGNSMEEAKNVAHIVFEGVTAHSYSDINEQLEVLSNKIDNRTPYVFKGYNYIPVYFIILLCGVLETAFLISMIIGLGITVYSSRYLIYGIIGSSVSLIVVLFNTYFIKHSLEKINFLKRYNKYQEVLCYHNIELIDDLADKFDIKTSVIVKDLRTAIKQKLIPQGHMGRDDLIIMVSDEIYSRYKLKQAVYDRYYKKLVEERMRSRGRNEEIKKILETGQRYVEKIHESNDLIKDKEITRMLNQMEKVVSHIFYEVDGNPSQADKLGMFINYYLPTTEKLLEAYIDIDENETRKVTSKRLKKEIRNSIGNLNQAFEGILDKFYQEQEMDLLGDIAAMEVMMKQEDIAPNDI